MFQLNEDMSIHVTRGDIVFFTVSAEEDGKNYVFNEDDVVRIKVTAKKDSRKIFLQKDFVVTASTENVDIILNGNDTKFGEVISKPKDYWYEVELNPFTNPQTIIGYDDDGAKIFKLFPEGKDFVEEPEEDIPPVDAVLDLTSTRPIQNQAVAFEFLSLHQKLDNIKSIVAEIVADVVSKSKISAKLEYDASTEELTLLIDNVGGAE